MKISRYIYLPLIFSAYYAFFFSLISYPNIDKGELLIHSIMGWVFAVGILLYSDYRARKKSQSSSEEIYEVRQKREFTLLLPFEKAFELCLESVSVLDRAKIKKKSFEKGKIVIKTKISWETFGNRIIYRLRKINDHLTEVSLLSVPIPRTAVVDYGDGWKIVEDISKFLKEKDAEINKKVLTDSAMILEEVYVKPFEKQKI